MVYINSPRGLLGLKVPSGQRKRVEKGVSHRDRRSYDEAAGGSCPQHTHGSLAQARRNLPRCIKGFQKVQAVEVEAS